MGLNLVTLAEYKTYAGINNPNQDTLISTIIPKASQLCKSYCRRTFIDYVNETKVDVFKGGPYLQPTEVPVIQIISVEYSDNYGKTYVPLVEYTDYVLDTEEQVIKPVTSTEFSKAVNAYKVTYNAGFDNIPQDLHIAVMDLVTYYLKQDMSVKSQRDAGSNTVQIEYITKNTLPSHISRVFDLYKDNVS